MPTRGAGASRHRYGARLRSAWRVTRVSRSLECPLSTHCGRLTTSCRAGAIIIADEWRPARGGRSNDASRGSLQVWSVRLSLRSMWHVAPGAIHGAATPTKDINDDTQREPPHGRRSICHCPGHRCGCPSSGWTSRRWCGNARTEFDDYPYNHNRPPGQSGHGASACHRAANAVLRDDGYRAWRFRERAGLRVQWWHGRHEICRYATTELKEQCIRFAIRRRLRKPAALRASASLGRSSFTRRALSSSNANS